MNNIKSRWKKVFSTSRDVTFEQELSTGSVWTKRVYLDTGLIDVTRYPSWEYMDAELLGSNDGSLIREWTIEY